jgi:excisionase family DNA binding protein
MSIKAGEMARLLGVSRMHLWRLAKAGRIPGARLTVGGHWFWLDTASLRRWLEAVRLCRLSGKSTLSKACLQRQSKNRTAAGKRFNKVHEHFMAEAKCAGPRIVEAINAMRAMGIYLKELLGRERVTRASLRDWLCENPGELCVEEIGWLMDSVRVSNRLAEGELKQVADAPYDILRVWMKRVEAEATASTGAVTQPLPSSVAQSFVFD